MRRDRRRVTKVAALVMVMALVALLGASLAVSPDTTSTTTTTRPTTPTSEVTTTTIDPALLSGPAKELEALAAKGRAGRFHVSFQVTGDSFASDITSAAVELWRANGRLRQDTSQTSPAGITKSQTFSGPDGTTQCLQQAANPATCTQVSTTPGAQDDLVSGIEVLVNTGSTVTAKDDTAAGGPVRCFDVGAGTPAASGSVCFTPAGVPVRLLTPHFTLTVTTVDDAVDDSTFTLPSPVTPATTVN